MFDGSDGPTGRNLTMCENDPKYRTGRGNPNMTPEQMYDADAGFDQPDTSVVLGNAISRVVSAMSELTKTDLLESIIGDNLANCGDTSTLEMFTRVSNSLPSQFPYKVDPIKVRALCAAASSACGMIIGGVTDDAQATSLAEAAAKNRIFRETIR